MLSRKIGLPLRKILVEEINNDGKVGTFVVGGKNDCIHVFILDKRLAEGTTKTDFSVHT